MTASRLSRRAAADDGEGTWFPIDLTPMIDCVFLLLIFFMVSTRFTEPFGYQVELPQAQTAPHEARAVETPILSVLADGRAMLNGRSLDPAAPIAVGGSKRAIVRADRNARHGDVIAWMDRLHAAGVDEVTLATAPLEKSEGL